MSLCLLLAHGTCFFSSFFSPPKGYPTGLFISCLLLYILNNNRHRKESSLQSQFLDDQGFCVKGAQRKISLSVLIPFLLICAVAVCLHSHEEREKKRTDKNVLKCSDSISVTLRYCCLSCFLTQCQASMSQCYCLQSNERTNFTSS